MRVCARWPRAQFALLTRLRPASRVKGRLRSVLAQVSRQPYLGRRKRCTIRSISSRFGPVLKTSPNAGRLRYQKRPSESDSSDGIILSGPVEHLPIDIRISRFNVPSDQLMISIRIEGAWDKGFGETFAVCAAFARCLPLSP